MDDDRTGFEAPEAPTALCTPAARRRATPASVHPEAPEPTAAAPNE